MNNLKEQKMNNKGFSLVELIIVIAIMAVLIGVLAPQYLKYVEKSRQSADLDNVDSILSAVTTYSADPANQLVIGHVTCASGVVTADGAVGTKGDVKDALNEAGINLPTTALMKSKAYQAWDIEFKPDGTMAFTGTNGPALQTALGH